MAKIVYNACYGGFSLSESAVKLGREISGNPKWEYPSLVGEEYGDGEVIKYYYGAGRDIERHDPVLVAVVESLGDKANGDFAKLAVMELESGTPYRIDEYDGYESVVTADRIDWAIAP